jgi:CheY-like chemotaxis protein
MTCVALVIEDEEDTGELLAEILRRRGFAPAHFTEGRPALARAREVRPDLILLDLMLPDIDGYEVCERLKEERATNPIAVVMVAARHLPADRLRGLQAGADGYLVKPFTAGQLLEAAQAALWRQEMIREHGTAGEVRFCPGEELRQWEGLNELRGALFAHTCLPGEWCRQLVQTVTDLGLAAREYRREHRLSSPVVFSYRIDEGRVQVSLPGPEESGEGVREAVPGPEWSVWGLRPGDFDVLLAGGLIDDLCYDPARHEVRLVKEA